LVTPPRMGFLTSTSDNFPISRAGYAARTLAALLHRSGPIRRLTRRAGHHHQGIAAGQTIAEIVARIGSLTD
jgi:hypothetical protein